MIAEQKMMVPEKKISRKEKDKKESFVKQVKKALKKIKFLSMKDAFKRLGVVTIIVTILSLLVTLFDFAILRGMDVIQSISFNAGVFKTICAVVFVLLAVVLIVAETIRRSKTKGFSVTSSVNKRYKTGDDYLSMIIRVCGILLFIVSILMYIMR